jgi:hypothetical protein
VEDVLEDGLLMVLTIFKNEVLYINMTILMWQKIKIVKFMVDPLKLEIVDCIFHVLTCLKQLKKDPLLCQLLLISGFHIVVEYLTTVTHLLIMLLFWLELWMELGRSKIHGGQVGEKEAILDLPQEILAIFVVLVFNLKIDLRINR